MKYTESLFQNSGSFKGKVDKKTLNQEKKIHCLELIDILELDLKYCNLISLFLPIN